MSKLMKSGHVKKKNLFFLLKRNNQRNPPNDEQIQKRKRKRGIIINEIKHILSLVSTSIINDTYLMI